MWTSYYIALTHYPPPKKKTKKKERDRERERAKKKTSLTRQTFPTSRHLLHSYRHLHTEDIFWITFITNKEKKKKKRKKTKEKVHCPQVAVAIQEMSTGWMFSHLCKKICLLC